MNGPGFITHVVLLNQRACIDQPFFYQVRFFLSLSSTLLNFITHLVSLKPTPSKKAAAALAAVSLESPSKALPSLWLC
jgi:hypothetical protein